MQLPSRLFHRFGIAFCLVLALFFLLSFQRPSIDFSGSWSAEVGVNCQSSVSSCEEHHIVIVIGGYKTINHASPLFKSLLYHHRGPLFFHFITDKQAEKVLRTLFDTWKIPSVRYRTYDLEPYKKEVTWIPNNHYSSIYGLMRLVIPYILPEDVKEALFMDTDLIAIHDITPIFDTLKGTNKSVLLAMADNLSPWYTQKGHWPARGRGFNAGLILLHLERMRKANWSEMWNKEAKERFKSGGNFQDQDILNAITLSYPDIVVKLPCEYNLQLGVQAQPLTCVKDDRFVKMVHFNSQEKLTLKSKYVVYFGRFYNMYKAMDGNVFRARERCEKDISASTNLADLAEKDIECDQLLTAIRTTYRTHLYFNGFTPSTADGDVTLVTHLSVDRIDMFGDLLESWNGPVSAAIYCTDAELSMIEKFMTASRIARGRKNIALHAVFKTGSYYPINYLRNVALNASTTDYVYLTDVDFIPSKDLYKNLRAAADKTMKKSVLVVPAFEILAVEKLQFPKTKDDLIKEWEDGNIQPFGTTENTTELDQWINAESLNEINFQQIAQFSEIIPRADAPLSEERLIGYGWNNILHYSSLHDKQYKFLMVPSGFTVHHPHAAAFETSRYSALALYKKCMRVLKKQFTSDSNFQKLVQKAISPYSLRL